MVFGPILEQMNRWGNRQGWFSVSGQDSDGPGPGWLGR